MKKLVSIVALLTIATPSFAATKAPRPSHLTRNSDGGYDVTYSYTDKAKSGWYGSLRAELGFLNWENKYYVDGESIGSDKYPFKPRFTVNGAFGKHIGYFWRAEVEAGYISEFSDTDDGVTFKMALPYVMANGYYDFSNGLYLGAGVGVSLPMTELIADGFTDAGNSKHTGVSPMGGLMFGFAHQLDDNLVLDLRYRFAGTWGSTQERRFDSPEKKFENKIGFIMDNSVSLGIRYEF